MSTTTIDVSVVPEPAATPGDAARLVARDGAAVASGLATLEEALGFARASLGDRAVRVAPQFEATTSGYLANRAKLDGQAPDPRGRVRRFTPPGEVMVPHNDGYGFGDLAPDQLFLWCDTPDPDGGASWLVDGVALLLALEADEATRPLARFCWDVPVDHSEPGFIAHPPSPIARRLACGRAQVRHQPYLAATLGGPDEAAETRLVEAWREAVHQARDRARRFRLEPGQLLCVDNYRLLHGRDGYALPERKLVSVWGWTVDAVAVPEQAVSIV